MPADTIPAMDAVVHILKSEGVDTAFGCPGAAILPLYQALEKDGSIEHLIVRHEEGATHMADGWSRTNGRVGIAIGTSGPAGTNMITGLHAAFADSVPIICVTGRAAPSGSGKGGCRAADIVEIAEPVTKWAVQVKEAAQAPWIFREAFRTAREGRPGPVLIDLPLDVQRQFITYDPALDTPLPAGRDDLDSIPIRALRVYREINESFGENTYFVTSAGPCRIRGGRHLTTRLPVRHLCGRAGPLGWEIPAAIGVKKALKNTEPDAEVVGIVGDYGFQYLVEELAVAAQYHVPFVIIMLNNEYLGLIRQGSVEDEAGTDNVRLMEAYGCSGRRVLDPADIGSAIAWARKEAVTTSRPVLVEIMTEREADTPPGLAVDPVGEFAPLPPA